MNLIKYLLPPSSKRVEWNTSHDDNDKIAEATFKNIKKNINKKNFEIAKRIKELNYESDTEKVLEASAASLTIINTILGFAHDKKWFVLNGIVGLFLLQHALQGWCPPLPIIRKLGIRTPEEIYSEKIALKILKGDY